MAEVLSQSQIDALLNAALSGGLDEPAEEAPEKKYRKYDFYSPRKFTKDRLRILNGIFDSYTRIINSRINGLLHTNCEVEVDSVEEQRYYEFSNALTEGDVLTLAYLNRRGNVDETPVLLYVSTQVMLSMIDRMIGGEGEPDSDLPTEYSMTDMELKLYETIMEDLVSVMGSSWENYITVDFDYGRVEVNPTLVQLISLDETVVIVDLKLKFSNCVGRLSVCLPGMMLTNIFAEISRETPGQRGGKGENSEEIFDALRDSELEMVAELCHTKLQLSDIYNLNVGDVIDLNYPKDGVVQINIGRQRWFDGKMGVHNNKMAIKIGNTYYEPRRGDEEQDGE